MVRTRFAPSPTGFLHVGGAYSALLDFAYAQKMGGRFIIRIEDTDVKRTVKGAEEKIYQGLEWLGLKAAESPQIGGPYGPYRQSERLPLYQKYAQKLIDKNLAYYCFCSPRRLARIKEGHQKDNLLPMYDRQCRSLDPQKAAQKAAKTKHVIRLKIPFKEKIIVPDLARGNIVFESKIVDDQVLLKSDGFPTYHLAVVVDDHLMKITHVIRGEEWLSSAPKHVLLYQYLKWKAPQFLHTPTIRNPDRSKLSKRQGHTALSWYQQNGYLPQALLNFLFLLGWSHPKGKEIFDLKEFIKHFDLKDLSPVGPAFDLQKLTWMNGVYLRQTPDEKLLPLVKPFAPKEMKPNLITQTLPAVKERIKTLTEYAPLVEFLVKKKKPDLDELIQAGKNSGETKAVLLLAEEKLQNFSPQDWQATQIEEAIQDLIEETGWEKKDLYMTLRVAATGSSITPPLFDSLAFLGQKEALSRLKTAINLLRSD